MTYKNLVESCLNKHSSKRNCVVDFACGGLRQSFHLVNYFNKVIAYDFNKTSEWRDWQLSILENFQDKEKIELQNEISNINQNKIDLVFFSWPEMQFVDSIVEDMKMLSGLKIVICKSRLENHDKEDYILDLQNKIPKSKENKTYPESIYKNHNLISYSTEYIDDLVPENEYKRLTNLNISKPLGYVDVFVME